MATPNPASCTAPKAPTKPVSVASARLLRMGCSDSGAPTRRISMNSRRSRRIPRSVSWIAVRPEATYQDRIALDAVNEVTVAMPAPAMPSFGRDIDQRQHGGLAGAAHHAGQRAEQPIGERAGEDRIRVFKRGRARFAAAAHQPVDRRSAQQQNGAEDGGHRRGDDDAMND